MHKEKVVYGIYINAPAEKIWDALTKSEFIRQYFWGMNVDSDWEDGSKIRRFSDDDVTFGEGEVLKAEPGKLIQIADRMIGPTGS